jgi:hypothetical protein
LEVLDLAYLSLLSIDLVRRQRVQSLFDGCDKFRRILLGFGV